MDGARPVLGPRTVGEGRPGRHAHLPAPPSFVPADRSAGRPVRTKHLCSPGWSHIWDTLPWRWGSRRRPGGSQGAGQGNEQPEAWGPLPTCGPGPPQFPHLGARPPRDVRGQGVCAQSGLGARASRARWLRGLHSVCDPPSFEPALWPSAAVVALLGGAPRQEGPARLGQHWGAALSSLLCPEASGAVHPKVARLPPSTWTDR